MPTLNRTKPPARSQRAGTVTRAKSLQGPPGGNQAKNLIGFLDGELARLQAYVDDVVKGIRPAFTVPSADAVRQELASLDAIKQDLVAGNKLSPSAVSALQEVVSKRAAQPSASNPHPKAGSQKTLPELPVQDYFKKVQAELDRERGGPMPPKFTDEPGRRISYQPPSRTDKKGVVVYLAPETAKDVRVVAAMKGLSTQEYLVKLIEGDIAAHIAPSRIERTVKDAVAQIAKRHRKPSPP